MRTLLLVCLLSCVSTSVLARPSSSSRSYRSGSFRSSSPSFSSRPSTSYTPRSYGSQISRSYTPARQSAAPAQSYGSTTSRTYAPATPSASSVRSVGATSSRTYSTAASQRPTTTHVYLSPYAYHPPFVNHYYYDSYGSGGMPWWGWLMLWNSSSHPAQANYAGGADNYGGSAGRSDTPVNWAGVAIWFAIIAALGGGIAYFTRRSWA